MMEPKLVFDHFYKIVKIPRPSGNEEKIRQYLIKWANQKGFTSRKDKIGNVAIDVPARPGYENGRRVILQAHMDMVCVGGNERRATTPIVSGKWLKAKNTTLGADNGIGLAMALASAEDKAIKHGPMTILITVNEEEGMTGARQLGGNLVPNDSAFLFNLDSEEGVEYICRGSVSGDVIEASRQLIRKINVKKGMVPIKIAVRGLLGGHSGVDIHKGHGNAIKILGNFLGKILKKFPEIELVSLNGGERSNVIPSQAGAEILTSEKHFNALKKFSEQYQELVKKQLGEAAEGLNVDVRLVSGQKNAVLRGQDSHKILRLIEGVKDAVLKTVAGHGEKVLTSSTLGVVRTQRDKIKMTFLPRAASEKDLQSVVKQIIKALRMAGFSKINEIFFQGWEEPLNSAAVKVAAMAYQKIYRRAAVLFSCHAGLESAEIQSRLRALGYSQIPSVSIGPLIVNAHSVREAVYVPSVREVYELLKAMLGEVSKK